MNVRNPNLVITAGNIKNVQRNLVNYRGILEQQYDNIRTNAASKEDDVACHELNEAISQLDSSIDQLAECIGRLQ